MSPADVGRYDQIGLIMSSGGKALVRISDINPRHLQSQHARNGEEDMDDEDEVEQSAPVEDSRPRGMPAQYQESEIDGDEEYEQGLKMTDEEYLKSFRPRPMKPLDFDGYQIVPYGEENIPGGELPILWQMKGQDSSLEMETPALGSSPTYPMARYSQSLPTETSPSLSAFSRADSDVSRRRELKKESFRLPKALVLASRNNTVPPSSRALHSFPLVPGARHAASRVPPSGDLRHQRSLISASSSTSKVPHVSSQVHRDVKARNPFIPDMGPTGPTAKRLLGSHAPLASLPPSNAVAGPSGLSRHNAVAGPSGLSGGSRQNAVLGPSRQNGKKGGRE